MPVITLEGDSHASRAGVSLLSNIGLRELIAASRDEYLEIAVHLASGLRKLHQLRQDMRGLMLKSSLADADRFTLHLEKSYRQVWESWCSSRE